MCFIHKWSKWEEYIETFIVFPGILYPKEMQGKPIKTNETWQKKNCLKCGYTKRERVQC